MSAARVFTSLQPLGKTRVERRKGHYLKAMPGYKTWSSMVQRCTNPNNPDFPKWGGRGITICDEWRNSSEAFLLAVGPRPSQKHTIDRIDNNAGYFPGNVRWATRAEQNANTSANRHISHDGETHHMSEWARIKGLPLGTLHYRLVKGAWPVDRALNVPARLGNRLSRLIAKEEQA